METLDIEAIQNIVLLAFLTIVALSVVLYAVKIVWNIITSPAAIAICISIIAVLLYFVKV
jgi:hypothetical protein